MKKLRIIYLILLLPISGQSQVEQDLYEYIGSPFFSEKIKLFKDGTFIYQMGQELWRDEIEGNWQVRNDSILVLDSHPQKNKILVWESYKTNKKKDQNTNTFRVKDSRGGKRTYHLHLITERGDTILFKDQFDKTIVVGKFVAFYLANTTGLYSPVYKIIGGRANFFDILFEHQRVFENEHWKYYGDYIIPLNRANQKSSYKLLKKELRKEE